MLRGAEVVKFGIRPHTTGELRRRWALQMMQCGVCRAEKAFNGGAIGPDASAEREHSQEERRSAYCASECHPSFHAGFTVCRICMQHSNAIAN
jgi:hypothetical protein